MVLRWVTVFYLVYLVVPIALLLAGSFGELWLNALLPTGFTTKRYRDACAAMITASEWVGGRHEHHLSAGPRGRGTI